MMVYPQRQNINDILEGQLSQYKVMGCLRVCRPPRSKRPTKEQKRIAARQKRIDAAVDQLFQSLLEEPHEFISCTMELVSSRPLSMRDGIDYNLEEQADLFLADGRRNEDKSEDPRDWLTKEQLILRRAKEIYNGNGLPDSRLISGIYRRAYNPNYGSRPGKSARNSEDYS